MYDRDTLDSDIEALGFDRVREIVELFLHDSRDQFAQLADAIAKADTRPGKSIAHRLRGAASNFGLQHLCDLLGEVESTFDEGEEIPGKTRVDLDYQFEAALAALSAYLHSRGSSSVDSRKSA